MHWSWMFIISAVFLALYDLAKKSSVSGNAVLPVLLCSTISGALAYILTLFGGGGLDAPLNPGMRVLALSVIKSVIVATSWIFTFTALRTLPISIATPIRASAPAIIFIVAFFIYGEIPSLVQGLGMLLVFVGYFVFSWAGKHEGIDFRRNRAVWFAFAGMILSATSGLWDKYVFQVYGAPVKVVQFWFQIFLVVDYAIVLLAMHILKVEKVQFQWRWTIPLVGILLAAADYIYFTALAVPQVPVSVGSLLRRFSVVITFVIGSVIFREHNLKRKSLALTLVLLGIILLCKW